MSLARRVGRLEAGLQAAAADAPGPATWMASLERLVGSLPDEYQQIVTADLGRLAERGGSIGEAWYRAGIRRLTVTVAQMVEYYEVGLYSGRLALPDTVAATLCDTFESADKRPVGRSGSFHLWNHSAAGACEHCGWIWWSPRLRDELRACPGCDQPLDLYLTSHQLDCVRPPNPYIQIPEAIREQIRAEVWERASSYYGLEGAEQFLMNVEAS